MENFLNWIGKVLDFIKNYGLINICKAWIVILTFSLTVAIITSPRKTLETWYNVVETIQESKHETNEIASAQIAIDVDEVLEHCIDKFGCYEAFILEGHNGTNNMNGVSFSNLAMRRYISSEPANQGSKLYKDFDTPVGMTQIDNYISKRSSFYGSIEEFKSLDIDLAEKLEKNGVQFVALVGIEAHKRVGAFVGYLGITYVQEPEYTNSYIISKLQNTGAILKDLLSLD